MSGDYLTPRGHRALGAFGRRVLALACTVAVVVGLCVLQRGYEECLARGYSVGVCSIG